MATDPVGARNMPLQTSKPHPGLADLTSTDNTDGTVQTARAQTARHVAQG